MRPLRIVAVLNVQWGIPGDRVLRWFKINPLNRSGARLISIIGHRNFYVTNACCDIVYSPSGKGTPSERWLARNLGDLNPDVVLVCGSVAQATFQTNMVDVARKRVRVIKLPHPAARNWTKASIKTARRRVARNCRMFLETTQLTSTEN